MGMKQFFAIMAVALLPAAALAQTPVPVPATILAQSSEYRYQLDFAVNEAALARMLPAGWVANVATQGPAKDCNIRLIFIDAVNIVGPDNRLLGKGTDLLVYIAAPVKRSSDGATGQMILGGISQNNPDAAFGVLEQARDAKVTRNVVNTNGTAVVTEDWSFTGAGGAHASLHVKYTGAPANRGGGATNFHNPADPTKFQIFQTVQATDISRNVTTLPPDRVTEYSYKVGGGKFATLFDGSEKTVSWDSQPHYNRTVSAPAPAQ